MSINKFTSDIIQDSLISIGEAMFETIQRTSMSPIIYEALDYAVGITDDKGRLLAQGNGVITFLAAMSLVVEETLSRFRDNPLKEGDVVIANTPYIGGGTHLSDIAIITPVFYRNTLVALQLIKHTGQILAEPIQVLYPLFLQRYFRKDYTSLLLK